MEKCLICKSEFKSLRGLATHIQNKHKLKTIEYVIEYLYNKVKPLCPICHEPTRYVSFGFKKYCKEHSYMAEKEGGEKGGKISVAWNKGLTKKNDVRLKKMAIKQIGNGNHFFGKKHKVDSIIKMKNKTKITEEEYYKRLASRSNIPWKNLFGKNKEFTLVTNYCDYFSRQHQYLELVCNKCGDLNKKTLQAFERGSKCVKCYPISKNSLEQKEVENFVESLGFSIVSNDRTIITPNEIDIYIKEKNVGIEYHGLHWHSEEFVDKLIHKEKLNECRKKNIQLIQIFSDEWKTKKPIVKSMIGHRLGKTKIRLYARKCQIEEISSKEARQFHEQTHVSGGANINILKAFALKYNDRVVACFSMRKPFMKKYKDQNLLELARFSVALDTTIVGGFSRMLKYTKEWLINEGYGGLYSYADLRFGEGKVYEKNGFKFSAETKEDYWYTDGIDRFNRFKFRAQDGKTEKQVAKENEVYKIYGCGSKIYEYLI